MKTWAIVNIILSIVAIALAVWRGWQLVIVLSLFSFILQLLDYKKTHQKKEDLDGQAAH